MPSSSQPPAVQPVRAGAALPHIRTFSPRRGRVSQRQQAGLDEQWASFGVDVVPQRLDVEAVFGRRAPLVLEVGFGMGEATVHMAAADPDRDLLAVDVHTPGVGALLHELGERGLTNVRVAQGDVVEVLRDMLAPGSLDEVRVFFPDPWPKERHRKRRIVSGAPLALMASRLRPGGLLHCATDWEPYARQMLAEVAASPHLEGLHDGFAPRPEHRPVTRFERLGLAKGHQVFDFLARRVA